MKKDLETLKRKANESFADEAGEDTCTSKRPSRRSSSEARVYEHVCICCKKVKFLERSRSREKLQKLYNSELTSQYENVQSRREMKIF